MYIKWASGHYRSADGNPSGEVLEIKRAIRFAHRLYGHVPATEFGPRALATVRDEMVKAGACRTVVNQRVGRLKRLFKWAASQELVPVTVYEALRTLTGLQRGRCRAREKEPVTPVDLSYFNATVPHLSTHLRTLVQLQRLSGCRPGEACALQLDDIDRSGPVWLWRPKSHKTDWKGKSRVIALGPKAQVLLRMFTAVRDPRGDEFVFSPRLAREEWAQAARSRRKTKVQPSQVDRKSKKPRRVPGHFYRVTTVAHAIARAAQRAGVPHWHPNQIRHLFATQVRSAHGLEAAQVLLGHSKADVTQVYAARDLALALRVAAAIG